MQMYHQNPHSMHEAAMIHAAHNGFPMMPPPHMRGGHHGHGHGHGMQHPAHFHAAAHQHHHQQGGHNNGGFPGHMGTGFMPHHGPMGMHHHQSQSQQQQMPISAAAASSNSNNNNTSEVLPSPSKVGTGGGTGTPGATPSRHLNFSAMEHTPQDQAQQNHASPGSGQTGGRTLPHLHHQHQAMMHHHMMAQMGSAMQQQQHMQGAAAMQQMHQQNQIAASVPQKFTKRLERELHDGSKEDLVKLVMELCDLNGEVNSYVESKAQLFALRPNSSATECASPYSYTSTCGSPMAATQSATSHDTAVPFTTETPLKQQGGAESIVGETPQGEASKSKVGVTPQTPLEELHHDLETRHCAAEDREFSSEQHPCLRLYSNCRYPTSCFFRSCPRNMCLNFLRGECTAGKDCSLVHRIPQDASPQILHMVGVCRGEAVTIPKAVPSTREVSNPAAAPSSRELFNVSDVANMTLDEEDHTTNEAVSAQ